MDSTAVGAIAGIGGAAVGAVLESVLTGRSEQHGRLFDLRVALYSDVMQWMYEYMEILDSSTLKVQGSVQSDPDWDPPWDRLALLRERRHGLHARMRLAVDSNLLEPWWKLDHVAHRWETTLKYLASVSKTKDKKEGLVEALLMSRERSRLLVLKQAKPLEDLMIKQLNPPIPPKGLRSLRRKRMMQRWEKRFKSWKDRQPDDQAE